MEFKRFVFVLCLQIPAISLLFFLFSCTSESGEGLDEDLLRQVDKAISETDKYDSLKTTAINRLKAKEANTPLELFTKNRLLFEQYKSYICDSALHYINENIEIARNVGRKDILVWAILQKADLMVKGGLFTESLALLSSICGDSIPADLKGLYYQTYETTYLHMNEYLDGNEYGGRYVDKIITYRDSVLQVTSRGSFIYDMDYGSRLLHQGKSEDAIEFYEDRIKRYTSGTREYSVLMSILAYVFQTEGKLNEYGRLIALSAISDMQGSIKENMAIRALAELCFATGEVDRAHKYMMKSMEDANFFSARMRKNQSAKLLPLVMQTYSVMQSESRFRLKIYLVIISVLAAGLVITLFYLSKQFRLVSRSFRLVLKTKNQMEEINYKLSQANCKLVDVNSELTESNHIKEEYIGKFMELCSIYISTLEQYRKSLIRQASGRKVEELYKLLRSENIINDTLKDFYSTFDTAFLNIFPTFVQQFNALFPEEKQVVLKHGEKLNTELRTFALIRLGMTDSNKIAEFLRCSITTIYSYRSRRKKQSLEPEKFDAEILKIGI